MQVTEKEIQRIIDNAVRLINNLSAENERLQKEINMYKNITEEYRRALVSIKHI